MVQGSKCDLDHIELRKVHVRPRLEIFTERGTISNDWGKKTRNLKIKFTHLTCSSSTFHLVGNQNRTSCIPIPRIRGRPFPSHNSSLLVSGPSQLYACETFKSLPTGTGIYFAKNITAVMPPPVHSARVIIVGDSGVGKSTILSTYNRERFNPVYVQTRGEIRVLKAYKTSQKSHFHWIAHEISIVWLQANLAYELFQVHFFLLVEREIKNATVQVNRRSVELQIW